MARPTRCAPPATKAREPSSSMRGGYPAGARDGDRAERGAPCRRPSRLAGPNRDVRADEGEPMPYAVPPLPYDYSALEPHIDEQTMRLHHDKHHQTYVNKVNAALEGTEWADRPIEDVLRN